ncbi:MAG: hypothetical protein HY360_15235 [Verrucomicrobia bacterium]|nr:hypothetical protein [Verrucomicrobiota bacterium]
MKNGDFAGGWETINPDPATTNVQLRIPGGWAVESFKAGKPVVISVETNDLPAESKSKPALRVETEQHVTLYQDVELKTGDACRLAAWCNIGKGSTLLISVDPVRNGKIARDFFLVYEAVQEPGWRRFESDFVASTNGPYRVALSFTVNEPGPLVALVNGVSLENLDLKTLKPPVEKSGPRGYEFTAAFDFGGLMSPVREGYRQVTPATLYRHERGFGFESVQGLSSGVEFGKDWGISGNALSDDFIFVKLNAAKEADHAFRVDAPNGDYFVRLLISSGPHFEISVNDGKPFAIRCPQPYNVIAPITLRGKVTDGVLRVRFKSLPQTSSFYLGWICHSLVVYPAADRLKAITQADLDEAQIFLAKSRTSKPWTARMSIAEPPAKPLAPDTDETTRGFALFTRSCTGGSQYVGPVFPETVPDESERVKTLSLRATPGEYEPVFLGVYPLRDQLEIPVSISDLKDAAGSVLVAAKDIAVYDIGYMRFKWKPGGSNFSKTDMEDWPGWIKMLKVDAAAPKSSPGKQVWNLLSEDLQAGLQKWEPSQKLEGELQDKLVSELNGRVLKNDKLYNREDKSAWEGLGFDQELNELLKRHIVDLVLTDEELARFNRLLLETAYPKQIAKSVKESAHAIKPIFLKPASTLEEVFKGECRGLWITVKAPDSAKAGQYSGTVTVGGKAVPLTLEVLPFKLSDPAEITWIQYFSWPGNPAAAEKHLSDMREHGMNAVEIQLEPDLVGKAREKKPLKITEDRIKLAQKYGLTHPFFSGQYTVPALPFNIREPDYKLTPDDEKTIVECTRYVKEQLAGKEYPEMLFYAVDEPNALDLRKKAKRIYELIKTVPHCRTFVTCTTDSIEMLKSCIDIRCYVKGVGNPELEGNAIQAEGAVFWQYMPNSSHFPGRSRREPGFLMWAKRCKGSVWWHYHDPGCVLSVYNGMDGIGDYFWNWPMMDGQYVTSLGWELVREGIDDFKYCDLLEKEIRRAKKAGGAAAKRASEIAADLEKVRQMFIQNAIPASNKLVGADYDKTRQRIIDWILELTGSPPGSKS